ncbi:uncharacterized protein TNCV_3469271 [Trichonephila clavipes]|nr:uncharacterized protein TNCV_3469271 [Trichonephila clavipes]
MIQSTIRKRHLEVIPKATRPRKKQLPALKKCSKVRILTIYEIFLELVITLLRKGRFCSYELVLALAEKSTQGLLAIDDVILNLGQVTWTTPEMVSPLLTTTPHQWEDVSALDRFNVHRAPTRRVLSGTELELMTRQATIRYLYHSATAA